MQVEYGFFYLVVALLIAVIVHKGNKLLPSRQLFCCQRPLIFIFQQGFERVVFQQDELLLTGQAEFGVHVQGFDMLAYKPLAEGMEGADISPGQEYHLPFQPGCLFLFGRGRQFPGQRPFNAFAHFGRRRIGKGHH